MLRLWRQICTPCGVFYPLKVDFHNIRVFQQNITENNMLMAFLDNANGPLIHTHTQK